MSDPVLLPQPQKLSYHPGEHLLTGNKLIAISDPEYLFSAQRLRAALQKIGLYWEIVVVNTALSADQVGVYLMQFDYGGKFAKTPWYELSIVPSHIVITGDERPEAVWYGVCTLIQLIEQFGRRLPCLNIEDYPDFQRRGVMLDISRDKVPTMDSLYALIDMLAGWKINEIQLYTEHTFAYRAHPVVWENASPLTAEEIMQLDQFCRARYIDLVPNQNSFGHMHRWLMHDKYRPLAEVPEGLHWASLLTPRPFTISPAVAGSISLIAGLYEELLPHFTSKYFNVGCDETFDLGQGRSQEMVKALGKGRVYLNFLKQIYTLVKKHGRTMLFWGDIIKNHPELIPELPSDVIPLEWGYEASHPFDLEGEKFAQAGLKYYVCPGTSSWLSLIGRTENALGNLRNAAENGKKHGAWGYLITDWGDFGHLQPLPVSYLGFAYGAALAWSVETNLGIDLPAALDAYAFRDSSRVMGRLAYDLGNAYLLSDDLPHVNGSHMVRALFNRLEDIQTKAWASGMKEPAPINPAKVRAAIWEVDRLMARLENASPADARVLDEYRVAVGMWKHGCKRMLLSAGDTSITLESMAAELRRLISDYSVCWLSRSRSGNLGDSLARLMRLFAEYE